MSRTMTIWAEKNSETDALPLACPHDKQDFSINQDPDFASNHGQSNSFSEHNTLPPALTECVHTSPIERRMHDRWAPLHPQGGMTNDARRSLPTLVAPQASTGQRLDPDEFMKYYRQNQVAQRNGLCPSYKILLLILPEGCNNSPDAMPAHGRSGKAIHLKPFQTDISARAAGYVPLAPCHWLP